MRVELQSVGVVLLSEEPAGATGAGTNAAAAFGVVEEIVATFLDIAATFPDTVVTFLDTAAIYLGTADSSVAAVAVLAERFADVAESVVSAEELLVVVTTSDSVEPLAAAVVGTVADSAESVAVAASLESVWAAAAAVVFAAYSVEPLVGSATFVRAVFVAS